MRPDHAVAKAIYQEFGLERVQWYQRLPFIEITYGWLTPEPDSFELKPPLFEHMVFPEMVLWMSGIEAVMGTGISVLVRTVGGNMVSIRMLTDHGPSLGIAVDCRTGDMETGTPTGTVTPGRAERMVCTIDHVCKLLASCPEHLVEIAPVLEGRAKRRAAKAAKKKPWVREDLPRIILLDPTKAREHGHRIDRRGTHASPVPHQRRGHWRVLKAERWGSRVGQRVWVRPAWIGDREWLFQGNRYRVLTGA